MTFRLKVLTVINDLQSDVMMFCFIICYFDLALPSIRSCYLKNGPLV